MDLSLSIKSLESLTNDDVCPVYTFKILVRYLCLSPELLAKEMDHLGKVLWYNNYPTWMIK